jgi:hypothetical protein
MDMKKVVVLAVAAALAETGMFAAFSECVFVDTFPGNRHWMTVPTNEVPLRWDWEPGAVRARLDISGMNDGLSREFTPDVSDFTWRVFETSVPETEDVYDVTLTFYDGDGAVVGALTSRLAIVAGAFGRTVVNADTGGAAWAKVKGNAVIPYDATWTNATASAVGGWLVIAKRGGAAQTNLLAGAAGYTGWKLEGSDWGYGTFDLSLAFPGTEGEWDATLTRFPDGTMLRMR